MKTALFKILLNVPSAILIFFLIVMPFNKSLGNSIRGTEEIFKFCGSEIRRNINEGGVGFDKNRRLELKENLKSYFDLEHMDDYNAVTHGMLLTGGIAVVVIYNIFLNKHLMLESSEIGMMYRHTLDDDEDDDY